MALELRKAVKSKLKLRAAMVGPPGSGKTWSALEVATHLVKLMIEKDPALASRENKVVLIDSERMTSERYADLFDYAIIGLEQSQSPDAYVDALELAGDQGALVTIVDSLSHAWSGKDGALAQVDKKAGGPGGSFNAWRDVTPMHNRLVDALLSHPTHLISTLRVKTEYVVDKDERGKTSVRKLGLAPVQRDGLEYEFDVVGDLDQDNVWTITKTRCPPLRGQAIARPGKKVAKVLYDWLTTGAEVKEPPPPDASTIERIKEAFASINVNDMKLEAYLGHSLSIMTAVEYAEIRRIWKSVKDGHVTWGDVYLKKHPEQARQTVAPPTTEPKVASSPATPPKVELTRFNALSASMAAAKTEGELLAVRALVSAAIEEGALSSDEAGKLGALEAQLQQALKAPAAPAAEAAKEGAPLGPADAPAAAASQTGPTTPAAAATSTAPAATGPTTPSPTPAKAEPQLLDRMNACRAKPELKALRKEIASMSDNGAKKACQDMYNALLKKLPDEVRA